MSSDGEDVPEPDYTNGNRAFVQAFLARGTLTFKDAKPLLARIFTIESGEPVRARDITAQDFDSYVAAAARALSSFDYGVRATTHQTTSERTWAIINTTSDPLTQLATTRSADELAFIKRVLDLMFETNNTKRRELMAFRKDEAVREAKISSQAQVRRARQSQGGAGDDSEGEGQGAAVKPKDNSITMSQAETILSEMVAEGWFEESPEKFLTLTPRALMELKVWLVASYNDEDAEEGVWQRIKMCKVCKDVVTVGQRCEDRECNVRVHDVCLENYFAMAARRGDGAGEGRKCGGCGKAWVGRSFVGEKVVTTREDWGQGRRKSKSNGSSRRHVEEEVEDEDEDVDMDEGPSGTNGNQDEEDEDEDEDEDAEGEDDDE